MDACGWLTSSHWAPTVCIQLAMLLTRTASHNPRNNPMRRGAQVETVLLDALIAPPILALLGRPAITGGRARRLARSRFASRFPAAAASAPRPPCSGEELRSLDGGAR